MSFYPFKAALSGIWREKWINALSVLTIATVLFLIMTGFIMAYNAALALRSLPDKFSITVFLDDGIMPADVQRIRNEVEGKPAVKKLRYISKDDALDELKSAVKDADFIFGGLEGNPLPASFELKLEGGSVTWEAVEALAASLKGIKGVSEVQYGKEFLSAIQSISRNLNIIIGTLAGALAGGVVFVCYSTVKILFYRKRDEVETIKFLGATKGFIRAPFLIEGALLGFAGGLMSSAGTFGFHYILENRLAVTVPLLRAFVMPLEFLSAPPALGLLIGLAGALIAVGRIRF